MELLLIDQEKLRAGCSLQACRAKQ